MKIAVTYDKGWVAPHLGQTTEVVFYLVEDGKIESSYTETLPAPGHGMIAKVLFTNEIDVLICGGLRPTALEGLTVSNIEVIAGAMGDCRKAAEAYLSGELKHNPMAVNSEEACGHVHDDEEEEAVLN